MLPGNRYAGLRYSSCWHTRTNSFLHGLVHFGRDFHDRTNFRAGRTDCCHSGEFISITLIAGATQYIDLFAFDQCAIGSKANASDHLRSRHQDRGETKSISASFQHRALDIIYQQPLVGSFPDTSKERPSSCLADHRNLPHDFDFLRTLDLGNLL